MTGDAIDHKDGIDRKPTEAFNANYGGAKIHLIALLRMNYPI